ncbi:MAG: hypothetical protein DI551_01120 [Micavibrio aeruginosavorus]|uniref:Uncharacterized protein n=1 Tax=Micavibrio aeruginosavorus TaxID=349221 RepID=A0A2W5N6K0_9BACT|nr:MAG: hypothetical protein DI551_01120 [Micavibrio aeruginosavorus]
MGGLTSIASTAVQALSLANSVVQGVDRYQDKSGQRAYEEAKQTSALQLKTLQQQNALEKEQNRIAQEAAEQDRLSKLRKVMAEQKARFGANGVSSSDGSSRAVLYGLLSESDEDQDSINQSYAIRNSILDQNYNSQKALNTLQLTQLKERSSLKKATALYNGLTDIF